MTTQQQELQSQTDLANLVRDLLKYSKLNVKIGRDPSGIYVVGFVGAQSFQEPMEGEKVYGGQNNGNVVYNVHNTLLGYADVIVGPHPFHLKPVQGATHTDSKIPTDSELIKWAVYNAHFGTLSKDHKVQILPPLVIYFK